MVVNLILRFLHWLTPKLQVRQIIGEDNSLYLERFKLFGWMPGDKRRWPVSLYLHRFHRADLDPLSHSHPWSVALSFILVGGYREERVIWDKGADSYEDANRRESFNEYHPHKFVGIETRDVKAGGFNLIRHDDFHRADALIGKECWTIFLAGPKASSWAFYDPLRGAIPWRVRLRERGIIIPYEEHEEV